MRVLLQLLRGEALLQEYALRIPPPAAPRAEIHMLRDQLRLLRGLQPRFGPAYINQRTYIHAIGGGSKMIRVASF